MIQITIHRDPFATVKTVHGNVLWRDHLDYMAAQMILHGRTVSIETDGKTGHIALFANDVTRENHG